MYMPRLYLQNCTNEGHIRSRFSYFLPFHHYLIGRLVCQCFPKLFSGSSCTLVSESCLVCCRHLSLSKPDLMRCITTAMFGVLTALFIQIQFLSNVTLCRLVNTGSFFFLNRNTKHSSFISWKVCICRDITLQLRYSGQR